MKETINIKCSKCESYNVHCVEDKRKQIPQAVDLLIEDYVTKRVGHNVSYAMYTYTNLTIFCADCGYFIKKSY